MLNKPGKNKAGESIAAIAEGAILSSYKFTKFKSEKDDFEMEKLSIATIDHSDEKKALETAIIMAESQNFVREINEQPANIMTPAKVADIAKKLAKESKLSVRVFDELDLRKMKMNALLSVSQGSLKPPRLVMFEYNKSKKNLLFMGLSEKELLLIPAEYR